MQAALENVPGAVASPPVSSAGRGALPTCSCEVRGLEAPWVGCPDTTCLFHRVQGPNATLFIPRFSRPATPGNYSVALDMTNVTL